MELNRQNAELVLKEAVFVLLMMEQTSSASRISKIQSVDEKQMVFAIMK